MIFRFIFIFLLSFAYAMCGVAYADCPMFVLPLDKLTRLPVVGGTGDFSLGDVLAPTELAKAVPVEGLPFGGIPGLPVVGSQFVSGQLAFPSLAGLLPANVPGGLGKLPGLSGLSPSLSGFNLTSVIPGLDKLSNFDPAKLIPSVPNFNQLLGTGNVVGGLLPFPNLNQFSLGVHKFLEGFSFGVNLPDLGINFNLMASPGQLLGDIAGSTGFWPGVGDLTASSVLRGVGLPESMVSLGSGEVFRQQQVSDLLDMIPNLPRLPITSAPAIEAFVPNWRSMMEWEAGSGLGAIFGSGFGSGSVPSVGEFVEFFALRERFLSELGPALNHLPLSSIPGLSDLPLGQLRGFVQSSLTGVLGLDPRTGVGILSELPAVQVPELLKSLTRVADQISATRVAYVDIPFSQHGDKRRVLTGTASDQPKGTLRAIPCQGNCPHLEVFPLNFKNLRDPSQGVGLVQGRAQEVPGGWGVGAGGREVTGWHPAGKIFKVAIHEIREPRAEVTTAMYGRLCFMLDTYPGPFGPYTRVNTEPIERDYPRPPAIATVPLGCTPYQIGPLESCSFREGDFIPLENAQPSESALALLPTPQPVEPPPVEESDTPLPTPNPQVSSEPEFEGKFFHPVGRSFPASWVPASRRIGACRSECLRSHAGVDLPDLKPVPIYASHDGRITEYTPVGGRCGGVIGILNTDPVLSKYATFTRYVHMEKLLVPPSATVSKGQPIGLMGDEKPGDCSFGRHLHYEMYLRGSLRDPLKIPHEPPLIR